MIHYYDSIIQETLDVLGSAGEVFPADPAKAWASVPSQPLILEQEKKLELGRAPAPSVEYTLMTGRELAGGNLVRIIGPDLHGITGQSGCFGEIVMLQVEGLDGNDPFSQIKRLEHMKYKLALDGYMARISAEQNRKNIRVGKEAFRRGISLERIGNAAISAYMKNPMIKGAQVIYLTEDMGRFARLTRLARQTDDITNAMNKLKDYFTMDCSHCGLKAIWDTVEGMRELPHSRLGLGQGKEQV